MSELCRSRLIFTRSHNYFWPNGALPAIILVLVAFLASLVSGRPSVQEITLPEALKLSRQQTNERSPNIQTSLQQQFELAEQTRQREQAIKHAFYAALYAQYLSGEAQGNLQYLDDWIGIIEARTEVGVLPGSELSKWQTERTLVADELARARLQLQTSQQHLRLALGLPPALQLSVVGIFESNVPTLDFNAWLTEAETRRPDLQLARLKEVAPAKFAALRLLISTEIESALALIELWQSRPNRLQLIDLPRVLDAQSTEDTKYYEGLGGLLPLLEATRTRRAVRQDWLRARYELQRGLIELEAAVGRSLLTATP
jgi:outer membrane protein TolC